ncbi:unnamed protein product [Owenia fusiformis]|uniref:Uncharacterized protein n=1 Tax=Owenia fusiformis TaxID=6347 RepID=A0A8J1Y0E4_OWEFU|nr:unnamed protein product [Owenia fusiformis]
MGSGASKRPNTTRKVQAVSAFQAIPKSPKEKDKILNDEITDTQIKLDDVNHDNEKSTDNRRSITINETSNAWNALKQGIILNANSLPKTTLTLDDFTKVIRRKASEIKNDDLEIPYESKEKVESEELCHICAVYTGSETYPCRICPRVYHESCLRKIGHCSSPESSNLLQKAHEPIGWSCYKCDNLSSVLAEEEMFQLMEDFDIYDIDKDSTISLDEFLKYKNEQYQKRFGCEMPFEDEETERRRFKIMDKNKTETLDWWEFLNYESTHILTTRSKNALVRLLTEREIDEARRTFRVFDRDGNGEISEHEAKHAFTSWYSQFLHETPGSLKILDTDDVDDNSEFAVHVKENTKLIMAADTDKNGRVSWNEYLKDQALYIIASRPNSCSNAPEDDNLTTKNRTISNDAKIV